MTRTKFWVLAILASTLTTSCGSGGTTSVVTPPPPPPPPTLAATVSASPSTGLAPLATNLTCLATGTADGLLSCTFHFGDATRDTTVTTMQSSVTVPHTYVSGSYPVYVSAERDGITATSSQPTTIVAQNPPPPPVPPQASLALAFPNQDTTYVGQAPNLTSKCLGNTTSSSFIWPAGSNAGVATVVGPAKTGFVCVGPAGSDITWLTTQVLVAPDTGMRATRDRPDSDGMSVGVYAKVIYMPICGGNDLHKDTDGSIELSFLSAMVYTAVRKNMVQKFDTYHQNRVDIMYHCIPLPNGSVNNGTVTNELRSQGYLNNPKVRLLVYYQGSGGATFGCGDATIGGQVAVLYLEACGGLFLTTDITFPSGPEVGADHELGHLAGMMDASAPNRDPLSLGHSGVPGDLMGPSGGYDFDVAENNYFGANVPAGVKNWRNDPIWISTPSWMASMVAAAKAVQQSSSLRMVPPKPFVWTDKQ